MQDGFAVAPGPELMAALLEALAQFLVVVDFAVGDQDQAPILVVQRLPAGLQIDDAETTHCKHHMVVGVGAFAIRPPVRESAVYLCNLGSLHRGESLARNDTGYATHV